MFPHNFIDTSIHLAETTAGAGREALALPPSRALCLQPRSLQAQPWWERGRRRPREPGEARGSQCQELQDIGVVNGGRVPAGADHIPLSLPFLGTNCDVTPTSKVAKTGEWSLVTMSSVQPGMGRGIWWAARAVGLHQAQPHPQVPLTIGAADQVGLWERLPEDTVTPRGDIDPHLGRRKAATTGVLLCSGCFLPALLLPHHQKKNVKSGPKASPLPGEG